MPVPPRISVVALRTSNLARSTAFYVALGWVGPMGSSRISMGMCGRSSTTPLYRLGADGRPEVP
jgi:catechol 2,3-dioxygenase-like lactoylglutathione lyase family enzyme